MVVCVVSRCIIRSVGMKLKDEPPSFVDKCRESAYDDDYHSNPGIPEVHLSLSK